MRTTSSSNRFKVYEFNEGDEQIEKESAKLFKKFGNPKSDDSALTKYDFLQCFARELKTGQKDSSNEPLVMETCNGAFKKWTSDNGPFRINPSNDDCIELSSSSTSVSDTAENEDPSDEQVLEDGFGGNNILQDTVLVSPDHILYGDLNCTECLLSFSCCGIKLEGSTLCGIKEHFSFEWAIDDLIKIESHWCGQVETDNVNLHLKSKDAKVAENSDGTSGTAVLNFAVPHWSNIQEEINSLNMRYKAIWNVIFDIDTTRSEDVCLEPRSIFSRKHHLSNFGESFEEVIYPKGDPDAVSICKRDIELLQPATFINDTIIDFYIQYLKNKIKPEEKHRFHFFSSFFFRKLADPEDPSRACEVREAFQRVCKWTRKVNLFQKDYIFIPVNFSLHWSLIVICHPGEVADFEGEEIGKSSKVPCILHMDSMKGSHRGLKNLIQSYLWEEWKERQRESVEDVSLKFLNLQFVSLELPQQENCFDCGLFLLHYVELFLEQAPVDFRLFSNKKFSHFLSKDWFPPAEVSMKRDHIRKLIYEIVEDNSLRVPQAACNDDYPSMLQDVNGRDTGVEFLGEISNSAEKSHGSLEITPLSASPLRGLQCFRESRLVFEDLLNPGATAGLLTDGSFQPFGQIVSHSRFKTVISPIEESEETVERFSYSPTEAAGRHADETTVPSTSYSAKTVEALQISMHLEEDEEEPVSSEVGVSEIHRYEELLGSSPQEEDNSESSSMLSARLAVCIVEDSEDANVVDIVSESEDSPSCEGKSLSSSNQKADLKVNNTLAMSEDSEIHRYEELLGSSHEEEDNSESSSMLSARLAVCIVEDSEDANVVDIVSESEDSPFCEGKSLGPPNQKADLKVNNTLAMSEDSEIHWYEELLGSSPQEEDNSESSSMLSARLAVCIVEDSEDANVVDIVSESEDSPSREGKSLSPSNKKADLKVNNTSAMSESELKASKKPRLMPPEIGRRLTRKLATKLLR